MPENNELSGINLINKDKIHLVILSIFCILGIYFLFKLSTNQSKSISILNSNPKLPATGISKVNSGINSSVNSVSSIPSSINSSSSNNNNSSTNITNNSATLASINNPPVQQEPVLQSSADVSADIRNIIQNSLQATPDNISKITSGFLGFVYPPKSPVGGFVSGAAYGVGNYVIDATDSGISTLQLLRLWSDDVTLAPFVSSPLFNNPLQSGIINSDYSSLITIDTNYVGYEILITLPQSLIISGILFNGPDYRYMPREFIVYGTQKNLLNNSVITGSPSDLVTLLNNTTGVQNSLVVYPINNTTPVNQVIIRIKSLGAANDTTSSINTLELYSLKLMAYPANMQKNNLRSHSSLVMKSPLKIIKQRIPKANYSGLHKALMTASLLFNT